MELHRDLDVGNPELVDKRTPRVSGHRLRRYYDRLARLYDLQERIGIERYCYSQARSRATEMLGLAPGMVVLDVACGTGANFPLLQRYLEGTGRIIAVDCSEAMLRRAMARTRKKGWRNVYCVQADAALLHRAQLEEAGALEPGQPIDAAICTFGLSVIPEWEMAYDAMRRLVRPGGRIGIVDVNSPGKSRSDRGRGMLGPLWRSLRWLGRADANRRPWLKLAEDFPGAVLECFSGGFVVVAAAKVPPASLPADPGDATNGPTS